MLPLTAHAQDVTRLRDDRRPPRDTFDEITGNRARNNIDGDARPALGADSPYGDPAIMPPIPNLATPEVESRFQPNCRPLSLLGVHARRPASSPAAERPVFGSLSILTGSDDLPGPSTTLHSVPLLNQPGADTDEHIAGRGHDRADRCPSSSRSTRARNSFWLQGGTRANPITATRTNYGFAALRCATDNLNGDNVEWIAYPLNTTHVLCTATT